MIKNFEEMAKYIKTNGYSEDDNYYVIDMEINGEVLDATLYVDFENEHIIVDELFTMKKEGTSYKRETEIVNPKLFIEFLKQISVQALTTK